MWDFIFRHQKLLNVFTYAYKIEKDYQHWLFTVPRKCNEIIRADKVWFHMKLFSTLAGFATRQCWIIFKRFSFLSPPSAFQRKFQTTHTWTPFKIYWRESVMPSVQYVFHQVIIAVFGILYSRVKQFQIWIGSVGIIYFPTIIIHQVPRIWNK